MAADEVIKIETKEAAKSVSDLRKEIKAYNDELSKTKVGTEEYQKTLEKLGATKDDLNDLKAVIGALNPEGKIAAFSNVAGKLAGGFQAATGAAALFGVKSEEVEKQLLKVQAATAFAQGIQSIVGLGDAFRVLATVIESNPIFLVAAALIAITVAVVSFSKEEKIAVESVKDFNDALDEQTKLLDENSRKIDVNNQLILEGLKQRGASEAQLNATILQQNSDKLTRLRDQESNAISERSKLLDDFRSNNFLRDDEANKLQLEKIDVLTKNEQNLIKARVDFENQAALQSAQIKTKEFLDAKAADAKALDDFKKKEERRKREDEQTLKNVDVNLKARQSEIDRESQLRLDGRAKEQNDLTSYLEEDAAIKEYWRNSEEVEDKRAQENKEKNNLEAAEIEKTLEQEKAQAREQILSQSLDAAKALSDLYFQNQLNSVQKGSAAELEIKKKAFNVNKAFAIADTIINGVRAVQQALTNPYPLNLILAAASGILAAANVAKIASTKFDSGSTSASAGTSISAPNVAAPSAPVIQPQTNINANGTVNNGAQVRTYVLAADVTDKQNDSNRIRTQSRF